MGKPKKADVQKVLQAMRVVLNASPLTSSVSIRADLAGLDAQLANGTSAAAILVPNFFSTADAFTAALRGVDLGQQACDLVGPPLPTPECPPCPPLSRWTSANA